jgi:hypothetical protein
MEIFRRLFVLIILCFLCSATAADDFRYQLSPSGFIPPLTKTEPPKLCARWFNNGQVLQRPDSNIFINVDYPGTANLRKLFVFLMVEGDRAHIEGGSQTRGTPKPFLQTLISRTDLSDLDSEAMSERLIQTLVANSDIGNITNQQFDGYFVRRQLMATLKYLYTKRYAKQAVRKGNVNRYQRQDARWARRTTRFTQMVNEEAISHIQAQHSNSPRQKLNFEEVFDTSEIIKRDPDELVFEIGRFELTKQKDLSTETLLRMGQLGLDRDLVFYKALQKVVTWLNHDVGAGRVFYYVSKSMQQVLEQAVPHMKKVKKYSVWQKKKNAKEEVLYECTRYDLIKIEDFLMGKIVEHSFMRDLPSLKAATDKDTVTWNWMFWPNEWPAVQRIRVGEISFYQKAFDVMKEAFSSYVEYRKANDMRVLWSQFANSEVNVFEKVKESLLVTMDWLHIQQLATDLGLFEAEVIPEPVEVNADMGQKLEEQFN